jgi:hypothetical protein
LRSERRPGVRVIYLNCRACAGDWLSTEDVDDEIMERWALELKKKEQCVDRGPKGQ